MNDSGDDMRERPGDDVDLTSETLLMHQVAFLKAEERLTTNQMIADRLNGSNIRADRFTVSAQLKRAVKEGILREVYAPVEERTRTLVAESLATSKSQELLNTFHHTLGFTGKHPPRIFEVGGEFDRPKSPGGRRNVKSDQKEADRFDQFVVEFGDEAAPVMRSLIAEEFAAAKQERKQNPDFECRIGVAWGLTLRATIDALKGGMSAPNAKTATTLVPLWGHDQRRADDSPIYRSKHFPDRTVLESTSLAREVAAYLRKTNTGDFDISALSLESVPDYLHLEGVELEDVNQEHVRSCFERYFESVSDLKSIFGNSDFLDEQLRHVHANTLGLLLGSTGSSAMPLRFLSPQSLSWLDQSQREAITKGRCVVGDVCGVLLPTADSQEQKQKPKKGRKSRSAIGAEIIEKVESRWLGIRREHLERTAKRGRESSHPGVVTCSVGFGRAHVIMAGLEAGLINVIVCDRSLARKLTELIERRLEAIA